MVDIASLGQGSDQLDESILDDNEDTSIDSSILDEGNENEVDNEPDPSKTKEPSKDTNNNIFEDDNEIPLDEPDPENPEDSQQDPGNENPQDSQNEEELGEEWENSSDEVKGIAQKLNAEGRKEFQNFIMEVSTAVSEQIQEKEQELSNFQNEISPITSVVDDYKLTLPQEEQTNEAIANRIQNFTRIEDQWNQDPIGAISKLVLTHPRGKEVFAELKNMFAIETTKNAEGKYESRYKNLDAFIQNGQRLLQDDEKFAIKQDNQRKINQQQADANAEKLIATDPKFGRFYKTYNNPANATENTLFEGYKMRIGKEDRFKSATKESIIKEAILRTYKHLNPNKAKGKNQTTKKGGNKPANSSGGSNQSNKKNLTAEEKIDAQYENEINRILNSQKK